VRVLAASHRDLHAAIQRGEFHEDLYYRIAVITIELPPLRDRKEDIDLLAFHFLTQYAEKCGKRVFSISPEALRCLQGYHWPGNVRELENTIERAVALETTEAVQVDRLPDAVRKLPPTTMRDPFTLPEGSFHLDEFLQSLERDIICQVLRRTEGNQTLAAVYLQLTKPSLRHRIQTLGIDPSAFRGNVSSC